tara:strand:- start:1346 stop:1717 length:372 start_codon:yes stop_codon:yes gene_type:complete
MKRLIIPTIFFIITLAIGYTLGGLRSGKIATEQAYHSDLNFFVAIDQHLKNNEIEEAKKISTLGINGALGVLDTLENEPRSPLVFILPSSDILLDKETRDQIRSKAEFAVSEEVASLGSIKSR